MIFDNNKISFLNEAKSIKIDRKFGFYDKKGIYNSIAIINGNNYRNRVECLIFRNNKVFLAKDKYGNFIIPSGSCENGIPDIEQVANECKEEARIIIKNTKYTGISYTREYDNGKIPPYVQNLEYQWIGWYSKVFIAEYDDKYKGHIDYLDKDERFLRGQFYNISEVITKLRDEWKDAIKIYLSNK